MATSELGPIKAHPVKFTFRIAPVGEGDTINLLGNTIVSRGYEIVDPKLQGTFGPGSRTIVVPKDKLEWWDQAYRKLGATVFLAPVHQTVAS